MTTPGNAPPPGPESGIYSGPGGAETLPVAEMVKDDNNKKTKKTTASAKILNSLCFDQALLPEYPKKSNSCILSISAKSKQMLRCTEIPATRSVLFLICIVVTISALWCQKRFL
jgi:hypothetical protein